MRSRGRRASARGRRRGSSTSHVATVNLDGASSSNEDEGPPPPKPVKTLKEDGPIETKHITLSPDKMCRGIMSDSSDSEYESGHLSIISSAPRVPPHCNKSGSDDLSDDIFHLDYSVHNQHALMGAYKELNYSKIGVNTIQPSTPNHHPVPGGSDDECRVIDSGAVIKCPSPTLFEVEKCGQREESRRSTRSRKGMDKTPQSAPLPLSKKQKTSVSSPPRMSESLLNISSDVISDEEEDVNPEMRVRIKWGSENFRQPIRKLQKFSHLYEVLAEKYCVSANRVVLNFNDKIINPEQCPGDLNLTIVDIIEGGVGSYTSDSRPSAPQPITQDADTISLRVQNSKKKGSINISIGLKDKMGVLMHKYAEEKRLNLDKLRFMFDGEELCVNSTASSLDLEGDECIDVFELT